MTVRELRDSDIPILQAWAEASGFEYPEMADTGIVAFLVVADEGDIPILAVSAKKLVEVYGYFNPGAGAELRLDAIRSIHGPMAEALKALGYDCAEVFMPPRIARRGFGRFLVERFGWRKNWPSWGVRLR